MGYAFNVMTQEQAEHIALSWHYDGDYSFYDMEADEEDLEEFLDPKTRGESTFAVTNNDELIGFFSANEISPDTIDIGLGMRPDLTGNGYGKEFVQACMAHVRATYRPEEITLAVATFNQRAIALYRKVGFQDVETYMQDTNGSTFEFLKMRYEC
ncbi:GNAT family N-acetyltransferase [Guptibacillus algicola]|uniref:GNAT family N-acetyltransferase n=1 Tax=Guptibacillus algicola TaxID=225844 RepID=UPI001CD5418F|nr:GNAT family protein [Alkalihalobacillus algicola]MCA0987448.1 GNAT family N-acetyltransferase [Alkalihalobacillus algicola]